MKLFLICCKSLHEGKKREEEEKKKKKKLTTRVFSVVCWAGVCRGGHGWDGLFFIVLPTFAPITPWGALGLAYLGTRGSFFSSPRTNHTQEKK